MALLLETSVVGMIASLFTEDTVEEEKIIFSTDAVLMSVVNPLGRTVGSPAAVDVGCSCSDGTAATASSAAVGSCAAGLTFSLALASTAAL